MKTVSAQDLEEQDVVILRDGQRVTVTRIDRVPLWIWVYPIADGYLKIPGDEKVTLIHRPYPEGENDATMRLRVFRCAQRILNVELRIGDVDDAIRELGEAIEAYELGKPSE